MGNSLHKDDAEMMFQLFIDEKIYEDMKGKDYGIENLVFQGSGAKAMSYVGAVKALEDVGILKNVRRFAGSGTGALVATRLALGATATETFNDYLTFERNFNDGYACLAVPNLIRKYGIFPGDHILKSLQDMCDKYTGNPNLTFGQLYKLRGVELCLVVTNVSSGHPEYWHPKTAPDYSIAEACKIVLTMPLLMQPVSIERGVANKPELFVDGAIVNNFPLHVYDGFYLDMEANKSFFHQLHRVGGDFRPGGAVNNKTIGFNAYDAFSQIPDSKNLLARLTKVGGILRPDTKLSRDRGPKADQALKLKSEMAVNITAAADFLVFLDDSDLNKEQIPISALSEGLKRCPSDILLTLFGKAIAEDPAKLALGMDFNMDKKISSAEFMHYSASKCIYLAQALYKSGVPREFLGVRDFANVTFYEIPANENWKNQKKKSDPERIVSIYTDYITRGDGDTLEDKDKLFAVRQGWKGCVRFLRKKAGLKDIVIENDDLDIQEIHMDDEEEHSSFVDDVREAAKKLREKLTGAKDEAAVLATEAVHKIEDAAHKVEEAVTGDKAAEPAAKGEAPKE